MRRRAAIVVAALAACWVVGCGASSSDDAATTTTEVEASPTAGVEVPEGCGAQVPDELAQVCGGVAQPVGGGYELRDLDGVPFTAQGDELEVRYTAEAEAVDGATATVGTLCRAGDDECTGALFTATTGDDDAIVITDLVPFEHFDWRATCVDLDDRPAVATLEDADGQDQFFEIVDGLLRPVELADCTP